MSDELIGALVLALLGAFSLAASWWAERSTYNPGNDDEATEDRW